MNWLLNRLREKTTWMGIFTLLGLVGIQIEPEFREIIINAVLAVAAIAAFVYRENRHERSTDRQPNLPPIELQGRSESDPLPEFDGGMRVPPGHRTQPELDDRGSHPDWHGFNDR